jgi:hypothetical protein
MLPHFGSEGCVLREARGHAVPLYCCHTIPMELNRIKIPVQGVEMTIRIDQGLFLKTFSAVRDHRLLRHHETFLCPLATCGSG